MSETDGIAHERGEGLRQAVDEEAQRADTAEKERDEALAALATAPHGPMCIGGERGPCNCWKSSAPGREEAAALRALESWRAARRDWAHRHENVAEREAAALEAAAALVATGRWGR